MNNANNAVAALLCVVDNGTLKVLLAKERHSTQWELPVQFVEPQQSLPDALDSVITTITGASGAKDVTHTQQIHTYDARTSNQLVHITTFLCLLREPVWRLSSLTVEFFPVAKLPKSLPAPYASYVKDALTRLQDELPISALPLGFMSKEFTMSELHNAYEAILGHPLDRRNFQKKIESLEIISKLPHTTQSGAHRPAAVYSAGNTKPHHRLPRVVNW